MELRICSKCKEYRKGNHCWKCGTKLESLPKCECGKPLLRHHEYCSFCGKSVPNKLFYGWPVHKGGEV